MDHIRGTCGDYSRAHGMDDELRGGPLTTTALDYLHYGKRHWIGQGT